MERVLGIYGREDIMWWLWSDLGSLKSGETVLGVMEGGEMV